MRADLPGPFPYLPKGGEAPGRAPGAQEPAAAESWTR